MLVHPVAIEGIERDGAPRRAGYATVAIVTLAVALCAVRGLAAWSVPHHGPLGERAVRIVFDADAAFRLLPDQALFAPWQPWTAAFVAAGWWQLAMAGGVVLLLGLALEAELGTLALASAILAIAPLAAAGALLSGGEPGLSGVACALLGMGLARHPHARLRWGFSYYAVVEVGHRTLFRSTLIDFSALYLALELLRCVVERGHLPGSAAAPWGAWLVGAAAGVAFGRLSLRLRPPVR